MAAVTSATTALSTGIMKDSASLQTALQTQLSSDGVSSLTVNVAELTPPGARGLSTGVLVVVIVVPIAVVLLALSGMLYYFKCYKKAKTTEVSNA